MAKEFKFDRKAAVAVVGRAKEKDEGVIQEKPVSSIRKDFYDLSSGEIIGLEKISRRVKRRLKEISNLNSKVFLDLYFAHEHWELYSRDNPFSAYLENEIQLSRSYAYGIIKGIGCLHDYLSSKGQVGDEMIEQVANIIDSVGISKVLKVANLKNSDDQSSWLNRLIDGEEIKVAQITDAKPEVAKKKEKYNPKVIMDDDKLYLEDLLLIRFKTENQPLREAVQKAVIRHYQKVGG